MKAYLVSGAVLGACSLAAALSACGAEPMNVVTAHDAGRGTTVVYDAPVDQVWTAAHAAIRWADVGKPTDHQERQDQWYVITDPAAADQVGIWLTPEGPKTRAKILVMDDPGLPGPNESDVKKDVDKALAMIGAGQPIGDKRP